MAIRVFPMVACLLAGVIPLPADAAPLGLTLQDAPDVTSGFADISYNASTNEFLVSGFALSLDDDGIGPPIDIDPAGSFNITATIDEFGAATAGTLSIAGNVLSFGPTLLTATLTDFGFLEGGGDLFEFLFIVDGGDLASPGMYGNPGSVVGVILSANGSTFTGSFDTDFDNNFGLPGFGQGVSDTAPIPEPATVVFMLLATALARRRGRRAESAS